MPRFERIEAVSKLGIDDEVSLDLQLEPVRNALLHGKDTPIELYQSDLAIDYVAAGHGG